MTRAWRESSRRTAAIAVVVATVLSVVPAGAQTREEPPSQAVETEPLQMTGHRPAPATVETQALQMTGYRPEQVAVETDGFAMTGYRPGPITVETPALRMTGYRLGRVSVGTDALQMTGYRPEPIAVETQALRMTGYRVGRATVDTGRLQMTGYGDDDQPPGREPPPEPVAIDTDALRMTGHRRGPLAVDVDAFRMTGYQRAPASVDTDALQMNGYRAGPLTLDTDSLRMTGYRQGLASVETDGFQMTGYRPGPATVDTAAVRMTGYRPDPATVDTAALRMTGYASRPGELPPAVADLEIVKFGPVSCEAGALCPFRFLVRNVGKAPFEGMLSVLDEPSIPVAGLGAVGPPTGGWDCLLETASGPLSCLAPPFTLAPGAASELTVEQRLPPDLRNGTRFENCVRLAPPAPGPNATRFVQFVLSVFGIDPGPIDGQPGPKTRAAVATFQTLRGLAATGEVDAPTRRALGALALTDGNAANDRACVSVGITKTITCGFGERAVGDACQPMCTGRGEYWDGTQCVICVSGTVWSPDGRRCVELVPACNPATTVQRGRECVCAHRGMQRVSATDCACPAGTNLLSGQGCVAAKPQCPFGKVYNVRTRVCDFICIPPAFSTERGCVCPGGVRYRVIGGCERQAPRRANPPPQRANPPPLLPRLFQR